MSLPKFASKIGMHVEGLSMQQALRDIEAIRQRRIYGSSFFGWPYRAYATVVDLFHTSSWSFLSTIALGFLVVLYMIDAIPSLFSLRWSQEPKLVELPKVVKRVMVRGSEGKLELLVSEAPIKAKGSGPAILFIHGGFGSASVWLPWIKKLHDDTNTYVGNIYALSLRGHGGSFAPGYLEMAYLTSMTTLSTDIAAVLREITTLEAAAGNKNGLIIAAHGTGGGLIQHAIASGKLPIKMLSKFGGLVGVALISAVPPTGYLGVAWNWLMADPFTWPRSYMHFWHPRSPLSSTKLVRGVFFSEAMPKSEIKAFEKGMSNYESHIWPSQMCFGRFVDVENVLARMTAKNMLVLAADGDKLVGVQGQRKMAREYANAVRGEDMEESFTNVHNVRIEAEGSVAEDGKEGGKAGSLQLSLIRGSGHFVMNDVKKDEAVEVFRKWADDV